MATDTGERAKESDAREKREMDAKREREMVEREADEEKRTSTEAAPNVRERG